MPKKEIKTNKKQAIGQRVRRIVAAGTSQARLYMSRRPHHSFRLTRYPRQQLGGTPLPPVWRLLKETGSFILANKKLFFGLGAIYGVISYFFIGGVSQIDFVAFREATIETIGGDTNALGVLVSLMGGTITGAVADPPTQVQQLLGVIISFLFWLVFIWAARMRTLGEAVTVRDALYNSGAPLIPSFLVVLAMVAQFLPAMLSLLAYPVIQGVGFLEGGAQVAVGMLVVTLCCLLSAYWIAGSAMALVAVTLPQMYPWKALSAASELVIGQRWRVALHLGVLTLTVVVVWFVIMFIALLLESWLRFDWLPIIPLIVQTLVVLSTVYSTVYLYKLYRSLL